MREPATDFAGLIKAARRERGWTQEQLADESGVGRRTIIRWEKGETQPEPAQVRAVAEALGIPAEEAHAALGWTGTEPEERTQPRTRDKIVAELLEIYTDPEDRRTLQDVLELVELRKARRRERDDSTQTG